MDAFRRERDGGLYRFQVFRQTVVAKLQILQMLAEFTEAVFLIL